MPKLKRVTISSELELDIWLKRNNRQEDSVMLVTRTDSSHRQYVSREHVRQTIAKYGWIAAERYTLGSCLLGHVITRQRL